MHAVLLFVSLFAVSSAASDCGLVQIALYPYYHDPEPAWRITIHGNGDVRFEKSSVPIKTVSVVELGEVTWTAPKTEPERTLSLRKMQQLIARLRELDLGVLGPEYSAQFSYHVPGETADVIVDGVLSHTIPAETTRVVTHGPTYELCANLGDVFAHTFVYAPLSALDDEDPPHPDRDAIEMIVAAWYQVLRATGPVHGIKAKMYRRYLE